jgi:hypothetical protein
VGLQPTGKEKYAEGAEPTRSMRRKTALRGLRDLSDTAHHLLHQAAQAVVCDSSVNLVFPWAGMCGSTGVRCECDGRRETGGVEDVGTVERAADAGAGQERGGCSGSGCVTGWCLGGAAGRGGLIACWH